MTIPDRLEDALGLIGEHPETQLLAGGTDFMVDVNFGYRRPDGVCALRRVVELHGQREEEDYLAIGAMTTYQEMLDGTLAEAVPGLAQAARTVGSPQIRNAGTLGGNLGTSSPAGDTLPVLVALDATVVVAAAGGQRELSIGDFLTGPKRNALQPGELIVEVRVPRRRGPQEFLKVGARNAMVISICSLALVIDLADRRVACALGSVGPTVLRAREAEERAAQEIDWETGQVDDPVFAREFGRLVAAEARPIDDHRSTAQYRRHAIGVLAERALRRST
ncbi:MAG: FAD binding domain-containing protein [Acidimicrobiia bacterium]